jgi:hypothetical protein
VVGPKLDRQMLNRRQKTFQDPAQPLQNRTVQAAATGRGAVDDLAAKHLDPIKGHGEEIPPPLLHIYRHRPVVMAAVANHPTLR